MTARGDEISPAVKNLLNDALTRAEAVAAADLVEPSGRVVYATPKILDNASPQVMAERPTSKRFRRSPGRNAPHKRVVFPIARTRRLRRRVQGSLGFQEEFGPWRVIRCASSQRRRSSAARLASSIMGMRPVLRDAVRRFFVLRGTILISSLSRPQRLCASGPGRYRCVVRLRPAGAVLVRVVRPTRNPESSFAHIPGLMLVPPDTR